jgi:hypothetical protein
MKSEGLIVFSDFNNVTPSGFWDSTPGVEFHFTLALSLKLVTSKQENPFGILSSA